jgi:hypothetical protein
MLTYSHAWSWLNHWSNTHPCHVLQLEGSIAELLDPYSDEGVRVVARVGKWKEGVEERSRSHSKVERMPNRGTRPTAAPRDGTTVSLVERDMATTSTIFIDRRRHGWPPIGVESQPYLD